MKTRTDARSDSKFLSSTAIVGSILAMGVIRMLSKESTAPQPGVSGPIRAEPSPRHRHSASVQTLTPPNRAD